MAAPLAGVSAAQIAQQKLQDPGAQQVKAGTSKFDQVMAQKAGEAQPTTAPGSVQAPRRPRRPRTFARSSRSRRRRSPRSTG